MALVQDLINVFNTPQRGNTFSTEITKVLRHVENLQRASPWKSDIAETAPVDSKLVCQLLEVIYDEKISDVWKIQLLLLIEEHLSLFAVTKVSGNQLVQSLLNVIRGHSSLPGYVGTLLQTIASVIVQFDLLMFKEAEETIHTFILCLLKILESKDSHLEVKYRAVQCLILLEEDYPTLFYAKLRYLYQMVRSNKSYLFEALLTLFITVLKNAIFYVACSSSEDNDSVELFAHQSESFANWSFNLEAFSLRMSALSSTNSDSATVTLSDSSDLPSILCYCLEQSSHRVSLMGQVQLVHIITHLLGHLPEESPAVLKTTVYRWANTSSISVLEALLLLKSRFGDKLFGILVSNADDLLETIIAHITCDKLPIPHRLLVAQWLTYYNYTENNSDKSSANPKLSRAHLQVRHLRDLLPGSFDPLDLKYRKVVILNDLYDPSIVTGNFLLGRINGIRKQVQYLGICRVSAILLKLLFIIHRKYCTVEEISQQISSLILGLTYEHISLTPATLHYFDSVQEEFPAGQSAGLAQESLSQLCDYVADHVASALEQPRVLPYVMAILSKGASLQNAKPKVIMEVLFRVVRESGICQEGDWYKGHLILDICKEVMKHQNTRLYYEDLVDVLSLIQQQYRDLNVADRASMLMNMLQSLSSKRIEEVFDSKVNIKSAVDLIAKEGFQALPNMQGVVTPLQYSLLSLTKKQYHEHYARNNCKKFDLDNHTNSLSSSIDEIMLNYIGFIKQTQFIISVNFTALISDAAKSNGLIGALYFPEIQWTPNLSDVIAHNWSAPYLDQELLLSSDSQNEIILHLENTEPNPFTITPSFECTYEDGRIIQSNLSSIEIDISDLCLCLPVQCSGDCSPQLKQQFLDKLRQKMVSNTFTVINFSDYSKSIFDQFIRPFKLTAELIDEEASPSDLILFFPPKFHVIMNVSHIEDYLYRIDLSSDGDTALLSEVESFLHNRFE